MNSSASIGAPTDPPGVDPRAFRTVCGHFATGVTVVTSGPADTVSGLTVNSFTAVSLDPPLVLVCIHRESSELLALRRTGSFAINILAADQEAVCRAFASRRTRASVRVDVRRGVTGVPILSTALAYLECRVHREVHSGDHLIVIGEVLELGVQRDEKPLAFFRNDFHHLQARLAEQQEDPSMPTAGLIDAAVEVAAIAERQADAAERRREADPSVMRSVVEAGFARHFAPARFGGREGTFAELIGAAGLVAETDPATSWCASLIASITRMAGAFLPAEGQDEIWAAGPDTVLAGSATPLGTARACDGGWILSGRWPYMSAVTYSQWALVCGVVQSETTSEAKLFAVPRSAYHVEDTWFAVGMQATGSNTLVLDEAFVPEHRAFNRVELLAGRPRDSAGAAMSNCYRAPLQAVNGLMFAAPAVGAAAGMARAFSVHFAEKADNAQPLPGTAGVPGIRASAEIAIARSSGEADAARLLLERAAHVADQGVATGPLDTARNLRDCSLAVDFAVTAVDRLFRQAGTRGQLTSGVMQRLWRDVTAISTHVALQFEPAARNYVDELLKT